MLRLDSLQWRLFNNWYAQIPSTVKATRPYTAYTMQWNYQWYQQSQYRDVIIIHVKFWYCLVIFWKPWWSWVHKVCSILGKYYTHWECQPCKLWQHVSDVIKICEKILWKGCYFFTTDVYSNGRNEYFVIIKYLSNKIVLRLCVGPLTSKVYVNI